jgi:hypothetical protein
MLMRSHHDVVHHRYAEEFSGCYEPPRDTNIMVIRHCCPGRMTVCHNNSRRMVGWGRSEYLSGMSKYTVQRADKYRMAGYDLLTAVDTQAQEMFLPFRADMLECSTYYGIRIWHWHAY